MANDVNRTSSNLSRPAFSMKDLCSLNSQISCSNLLKKSHKNISFLARGTQINLSHLTLSYKQLPRNASIPVQNSLQSRSPGLSSTSTLLSRNFSSAHLHHSPQNLIHSRFSTEKYSLPLTNRTQIESKNSSPDLQTSHNVVIRFEYSASPIKRVHSNTLDRRCADFSASKSRISRRYKGASASPNPRFHLNLSCHSLNQDRRFPALQNSGR
jgi:hypothetical protein